MSKSGVFAHFGSREELQISVVREYHAKFEDEVFRAGDERAARPAAAARAVRPLGAPRLGRDRLRLHLHQRRGRVRRPPGPGARRAGDDGADLAAARSSRAIRAAVDEGHLRADTDAEQLLFEIHGLILALHHDARFLRHAGAEERARAAFERLLAHCRRTPPQRSAPPRRPLV